ncbi:cellulose synthase/poly-beta-1,6-N-acetylglucosamine synthase-like glycosyltransferase [Pseudonocardia sediminis]|uniref:Cellulose synthase/poly-beta-1,6-N-acetylglucosamine synthase-like glycosyltransferase n=1 Tax=Pseudonocardia sediminis TaxID=1397368 RepID=A0A4Q7V0S3_PSEST|nr:glycosyltransferase [Pseudonocardia sediminis]RZT87695.1 cellulose synthase/poly-beta-1,6-N-acetylglucosamine synthase-like glycosyltransferase [Pseudonocardia sediminis]
MRARPALLPIPSVPPAVADARSGPELSARVRLATDGLADHDPMLSARPRPERPARVVALVVALLLVLGLVLAPRTTGVWLAGFFVVVYAAATVHRLLLIRCAVADDPTIEIDDAAAHAIADADLPVYTVLVPAYREPEVIPRLVDGLRGLDYPADRLEVMLLLEEDDEPTIAAAHRACPGTPVQIVLVPPSEPRTKPKACNFGLTRATGEFVTIYDAEDRPEPLQLRRAVVAFRRAEAAAGPGRGSDLACLQARLSYHNAEQNLLTRWFTLEYDVWFRWFLPGLMATRAPIPLGGTSNHIRRDVLVGMGAWDAWNVTEDADLGIRLARHGWRTAMLGSTTLEEANSDAINWVKQRSRWYKGYLQSVLVALRRPRELHRAIGTRGVGGLLLFVLATPVLALLNPVFWGLTALWWLGEPAFVAALFPAPTYYLGTAAWMLGTLAAVHSGVAVARAAGKPQLAPAALVVPAYWVLMSLAAAKAVLQLVRRPSYWEKTTHGLDAPATVSGGVS